MWHGTHLMNASRDRHTKAPFTRGLFYCCRNLLNGRNDPSESGQDCFVDVQLDAAQTTEWTRPRNLRTLRAMTTKRSKYDPLALSRQPRWLVLRDLFHN